MITVKRKTANYPIMAVLSNGKKLIIPKQSAFKNQWLKHHGCSLMAEYVALQWLGVKKIKVGKKMLGIYPVNLLKWHRSHTKSQVKSKVTVKGVSMGINGLAKGKGKATYYTTVTASRIRTALDAGMIVIMEQKSPIHTILLLKDGDVPYMVSYGKVTKISIDKIAKTATKSSTYRGMVVIKEV